MSAYAARFLGCPCPSEQVKGELERQQGRERDGEWNIFDVERCKFPLDQVDSGEGSLD